MTATDKDFEAAEAALGPGKFEDSVDVARVAAAIAQAREEGRREGFDERQRMLCACDVPGCKNRRVLLDVTGDQPISRCHVHVPPR